MSSAHDNLASLTSLHTAATPAPWSAVVDGRHSDEYVDLSIRHNDDKGYIFEIGRCELDCEGEMPEHLYDNMLITVVLRNALPALLPLLQGALLIRKQHALHTELLNDGLDKRYPYKVQEHAARLARHGLALLILSALNVPPSKP